MIPPTDEARTMSSQEKVDYKHTLNLPQTDFPMQAKLPEREPERLKRWQDADLSGEMVRSREGRPAFCLHDGPPYANGDIHIGHALNKMLKDVCVRYKTLPRLPVALRPRLGLPRAADRAEGARRIWATSVSEMQPVEIRQRCYRYALKWVQVQREQFQRLGITGDWEQPYLTIDPRSRRGSSRRFAIWSPRGSSARGSGRFTGTSAFRTALAEAEIEYEITYL